MSIIYTADDIFYLYNNISDFSLNSWEAPFMNVTKIIGGNVADGIYDCTSFAISFEEFALERYEFFEKQIGTLILAFLFNLMGKATTI